MKGELGSSKTVYHNRIYCIYNLHLWIKENLKDHLGNIGRLGFSARRC